MNPSPDRAELASAVMCALDEWGLSAEQIMQILALPSSVRSRHLERFRQGSAFPETAIVAERAELVLGIAEALRTTYPRNSRMASVWLRRNHRRFDGRSPLQVMAEDGTSGLIAIRTEVDCGYAWDLSLEGNSPSSEN